MRSEQQKWREKCWTAFCDFKVLLCDLLKDWKSWKCRLASTIYQTLQTVQADIGGEIDELVGSGRGNTANGTSDSLLNSDPADNSDTELQSHPMGSSIWSSYGSAYA